MGEFDKTQISPQNQKKKSKYFVRKLSLFLGSDSLYYVLYYFHDN